jgi:hypothetical protein
LPRAGISIKKRGAAGAQWVPATVKKKPPIRLSLIARRQCGNMPADRARERTSRV